MAAARCIVRLCPVALLALAGCSWFSDDEGVFVDKTDDYLQVTESRPLVIPEGLNAARVQEPYPVPPIAEQMRPQYFPSRPPRPDAIYANDARDEVRIQSLGERRWLVIPESPTTVWPKVKQFLAENGVSVAREAPGAGRLDTEWLEVTTEAYRDIVRLVIRDAKTDAGVDDGRDRIRLRVEPGLRERTTEVHVRHENDALGSPSAEGLTDLSRIESHLAGAEQEMLSELGAYIAARVAEQTVSMVAQEIGTDLKSRVDRDARSTPVLYLALDEERAWATVGQSLNRAEIEVTESDPEARTYEIVLPPNLDVEAEPPGFFSRLFSFGDDGLITVRLDVRAADDGGYLVYALDESGEALERDFAQQVLVMLREYAS